VLVAVVAVTAVVAVVVAVAVAVAAVAAVVAVAVVAALQSQQSLFLLLLRPKLEERVECFSNRADMTVLTSLSFQKRNWKHSNYRLSQR